MTITYANDEQGTVTIKFTKEETEQIYQNAVYNLKHNSYKAKKNGKKKKQAVQKTDVFVPPTNEEYHSALTAKYAKCVAACNDFDFEQTKQYLWDENMLSPQFAIYPDFKNRELDNEALFAHLRTLQDPVCSCNTVLYWHMLNKYYRRHESDPVWDYINNRFY